MCSEGELPAPIKLSLIDRRFSPFRLSDRDGRPGHSKLALPYTDPTHFVVTQLVNDYHDADYLGGSYVSTRRTS